jgi:hypothetical protein
MWVNEFAKLHFPPNPKEIRIQEAQALKFKHIPHSLYRYRSFSENSIENLNNYVEWQSYPIEFNDPFDAGLQVNFGQLKKEYFLEKMFPSMLQQFAKDGTIQFTQEEIVLIHKSEQPIVTFGQISMSKDSENSMHADKIGAYLDEAISLELDEMSDKFRDAFQKGYLVICFSQSHDSILMWSHYGYNHTGFCIEYDFKSLGPDHPRTRMLLPVIYKSEFFDATEYYRGTLFKGNSPGEFNNLFGLYPTILKAPDWQYEQEWRLVFPYGPGISKTDKENRLLSMPKPKKLFLGAKAEPENVERLLQVGEVLQIPVHQMVLAKDRFQLLENILYTPA